MNGPKVDKPWRWAVAQRLGGKGTAYERHRNWHVSNLGAGLVEYGLTGLDADAMMGLRCVPTARFLTLLAEADAQSSKTACIGDLLKTIINQHRGDLEKLGTSNNLLDGAGMRVTGAS